MNTKLFIAVFLATLALTVFANKGIVKNLVKNQPPAKVSTVAPPEDLAVSCTFNGDPHVKNSFNDYFDFYAKGDYLLAKYKGVEVYGRFNHVPNWKGRSVTTAVSVHVGNMRATYYAFDRQLKLNGQPVGPVTVGKKFETKSKNLVVTRIGDNKYVIEGGAAVKVAIIIRGNHAATDPNRYLDVEIFSSRKSVESPEYKGLCSKMREQILGNFEKPARQVTHFEKTQEHSRRKAEAFCHKLRHDKGRFHACVSDYVAGGPKLAISTLKLEETKKEVRTFFSQTPACREAIRQMAQVSAKAEKTNKKSQAYALLQQDIARYSNEIVPKACKGKRVSDKCKKAQKAYSKLAAYYNKLGNSVNPAQKTNIYKILQSLGTKSRQICDMKRAVEHCRKNKLLTIGSLNSNLGTIEKQIAQLKAQIKTEKSKKCKLDLSALKKFKNIRWSK